MTRTLACSCGGRLAEASLARVGLEGLFGLRGVVEGPVPGLRCEVCGAETFSGETFERLRLAVARAVLAQPRILHGDEARFLRKVLLGLTQERLARRMGINNITVADWERGERPMSKEHDYELRGIAVSTMIGRRPASARRRLELLAVAAQVLAAPRTAAPPARSPRYRLKPADLAAA